MRRVHFGNRVWNIPGDNADYMKDSNEKLDNREALLSEIDQKGYIYLTNIINREDVLAAKAEVLSTLADNKSLSPGTSINGVREKPSKLCSAYKIIIHGLFFIST